MSTSEDRTDRLTDTSTAEGDLPSPGEPSSTSPPSAAPERRRRPGLAANLVLLVVGLVSAVIVAEVAARLYVALADVGPRSSYYFRLSRPLPYKDSSYFSNEFVDAQYRVPGPKLLPHSEVLVSPDFRGRWHNVEGNVRRTSGQPGSPANQILLFGGSTAFNLEVPDDLTIPSHLQRLVNERFPGAFRVVNYGVSAANARRELARLKAVDVSPGDIVIFYDGFNEAYGGVYLKEPFGTVDESLRKTSTNVRLVERGLFSLHSRVDRYSYFVRYFLTFAKRSPEHLDDRRTTESLALDTERNYHDVVRQAHEYVTAKGATFIHFLQPHLFSLQSPTKYEADLIDNEYIVSPGIETAIRVGYERFKPMVTMLQSEGIDSVDLSSLMNERSSSDEEFYLDFAHMTERGNARVAGAMFERLSSSRPGL